MKAYGTNGIPLEAQYLYRRGVEMRSRQKDEIAIKYFKQAVFIAPSFSKAYQELGNCLTKIGKTEEAAIYHLKALKIGPFNTGMVFNRVDLKNPSAEMNGSRLIPPQLIY